MDGQGAPSAIRARSAEELYVRTLLGAVECLQAGITTVQDMLSLSPFTPDSVATVLRAYEDAGIRVVVAPQVADVSPLESVPRWRQIIPAEKQRFLESPAGSRDPAAITPMDVPDFVRHEAGRDTPDRVTWGLAASGPERCSPKLLQALADATRASRLPLFSHVAISRAEAVLARERLGGSAVRYLARLGALGPETSLAHCVWVSDDDIESLAETGTNVVANPVSNLKAKNGVAPLLAMHRRGVNVALGCDNTSCGDTQNMFGTMKTYALLAGIQSTVEETPTARDALVAATTAGARAVGLAGRVGSLQPGACADLVGIDLSELSYLPANDLIRQVVFAESGRGVRFVTVGGEITVADGKPTRVSIEELRSLVEGVLPDFTCDAQRVMSEAAELDPHIIDAERVFWAGNL